MEQFSHCMWARAGSACLGEEKARGRVGVVVWGAVASLRGTEGEQRRTRKSGNIEAKAIIMEMGQYKRLAEALLHRLEVK